jgi:putative ABC transport system permease protein
MNTSAVRALLRLARRDAWRHKGRSALIVLTVAFPVAGLVAAVTLLHALTVPLATKASWQLGRADASLEVDGSDSAGVAAALGKAVPAGSTTVVFANGQSRIAGHDGVLRTAQVNDLAYVNPLATGIVRQEQGREPRTPAEVTVSRAVADAAHLKVGSLLTLRDVGDRTATVVGIAITPGELANQVVWVAPGSLAGTVAAYSGATALVDLPTNVDATAWAAKVNAITRYALLHPVHEPVSRLQSDQSVGLTVLVSGLALLEAVLMAGAAFGVGARRSQRDLALIAATGGDAGQVRGVVLSGAVVLGTIAGAAGTALGLVVALALLPEAQHLSGHVYAGVHPRPLELAGAFLLGIVTAVISAWLPARGAAKVPVVASLSGRRGIVRTSRARVGLALSTAAIGTALCAWAGRTPSLGSRQFDAILFFAAIAELGFAGCAPAFVGVVGRFSGRLPLAARLSLRDIARNRSRTGPAVAAIMATLSGVVAMGVYVASEHARTVANYVPALPSTMVSVTGYNNVAPQPALVRAVADTLPTTSVASFGDGQGSGDKFAWLAGQPSAARFVSNVTVGGPDLLRALGISSAIPALNAGKAVLLVGRADHGVVPLNLSTGSDSKVVSVPAVDATIGGYSQLGGAIISPATAHRLGLSELLDERLLTLSRKPAQHELDAADAVLLASSADASSQVGLNYEHGLDDSKLLLVPLALLAISTLVTFGVTAISTALSAAESKGDFATLSAVGAPPAVRRRLAIGQAAVLALLGGVLGIAAGLVPMAAVIAVRSDVLDFTVPWQVIALALVGVPVIAGAGAGLFTRSRLPLARRLS